MQTCKLCHFETDKASTFYSHFYLVHRVGVKSFFQCGFSGCLSKFSVAKRYELHVERFHTRRPDQFPIAPSGILVPDPCHPVGGSCSVPDRSSSRDILKCACGFESNNRSTFRSHRFRKHKGQCEPSFRNDSNDADTGPMEEGVTVEIDSNHPSDNVEEVDIDSDILFRSRVPSDVPFEEDRENCPEDDLLKKLAHLYLTLDAKHHVPESTLQVLIEKYYLILSASLTVLKKKLMNKLAEKGVDSSIVDPVVESAFREDIAVKLHSPRGEMRTTYKREQLYRRLFKYVAPIGYDLGPNEHNEKAVYQYVPIEENLTVLLEDDSVFQQCLEKDRELSLPPNQILRDITDGSIIRSHELSSVLKTLFIILYGDEDEIVKNALGAARGTYKMSSWYYSLANLQPWNRSSVNQIQLALLCKEKDVSYFGLKRVLRPLIEDLQRLRVTKLSVRGEQFNVVLLAVLGDNLGQHDIFAMKANFSLSLHFCRYCEESRHEWIARWRVAAAGQEKESGRPGEGRDDDTAQSQSGTESDISGVSSEGEEEDSHSDSSTANAGAEVVVPSLGLSLNSGIRLAPGALRTPENYRICIEELESHPTGFKGIVAESPFHDGIGYHVVGATPPCYDHDILEGVVAYDVPLILQYFGVRYRLTDTFINRRVRAFTFLGRAGRDKPPPVSLKASKLKGHAMQNCVFLYYLPHLIRDKIDTADPAWKMLNLLCTVCKVLSAPQIDRASLPRLEALICKYLCLRCSLFPGVKLRPKHHFLEHYPYLKGVYGPLKRVSTLVYEQHHKLFKESAAAAKNWKNITFTLARRHQLLQASLSVAPLFESDPVMEEGCPFSHCDVSETVRHEVEHVFGLNVAAGLLSSKKLRFRNIQYKKGEIVVVSSKSDFSLDLCRISMLLLTANATPYVVGGYYFVVCLGILKFSYLFWTYTDSCTIQETNALPTSTLIQVSTSYVNPTI